MYTDTSLNQNLDKPSEYEYENPSHDPTEQQQGAPATSQQMTDKDRLQTAAVYTSLNQNLDKPSEYESPSSHAQMEDRDDPATSHQQQQQMTDKNRLQTAAVYTDLNQNLDKPSEYESLSSHAQMEDRDDPATSHQQQQMTDKNRLQTAVYTSLNQNLDKPGEYEMLDLSSHAQLEEDKHTSDGREQVRPAKNQGMATTVMPILILLAALFLVFAFMSSAALAISLMTYLDKPGLLVLSHYSVGGSPQ